jgi:hypothetical protein
VALAQVGRIINPPLARRNRRPPCWTPRQRLTPAAKAARARRRPTQRQRAMLYP